MMRINEQAQITINTAGGAVRPDKEWRRSAGHSERLNRGGAGRCPMPETAAVRNRRYRWAGFDAGGGPGVGGWRPPARVEVWARAVGPRGGTGVGAAVTSRRGPPGSGSAGGDAALGGIRPRAVRRCGFRRPCALLAGHPAGLSARLWGLRRRWPPRNHSTIEAGKPTRPTPPTTGQIAHVVALTFNRANQITSIACIEPPYRPMEQVRRCDLR
ncbi:hypothetical protein NDU88_005558 [Pleurodeles waltl]|uniref:Uncharacterized protein n=1 Tax=Pleurodeles waltl TaxID=8319 RepID=A0AAV7UKD6_PLEWA|nr:hypothetical protein NDU88_005558 [Pleurodeles waltl]